MNTSPSSSSSFLSAVSNNLSGSESDYGAPDYNITTTSIPTSTTPNNNIPPKSEDDASFVDELLQNADNDDLIIKTEVFHSLSDNDQSPAPPPLQNYSNDPTVFAPPSYHSFNSFPQVRSNSQFTGYVQNHHHPMQMSAAMGYPGDMQSQQQQQQHHQQPPSPQENYWYHSMKPPPPTGTPVIHHPPPPSPFMFNPPPPGQSGMGRPVSSYYHPSQQKQMAEMLHFSNR